MTIATPAISLAHRLRHVVALLARQLRPALQEEGISVAELSVIGQLHRGGPMTPTALAAREGVKLATLTRLLAELEDERWIDRRPHPEDGRQTLLRLTELGTQRLSASASAANKAFAAAIEQAVTPNEWRVLVQACGLLERLNDALATPSPSGDIPATTEHPAMTTPPRVFAHEALPHTSFTDVMLRHARFEDVDLAAAEFDNVTLAGARLHNVNLSRVAITDANLDGMTINDIPVHDLLKAYRTQRG